MSMELLRLGLQFFAGETKEEKEEVVPGEEGVPGASGMTGSTPPAYTMPENLVSAPKAQDFDTWYKANGGMDEAGYYAKYDLDPDRDYQNTVNTLNYEYQTSMATYGENAEKMYQMGLQNSGVSDIFQANAFSSYLGNMNQAAADRITARKKNKAAFNDYVAGMRAEHGKYETGIKTEYDTKLNSALTYALSKYNGYNLNQILSELGVSGYYTEIVRDVANRLSGMDSTTLKAETEGALAQNIINSISGFTGSDADKVAAKSMFGGMFPDNVIEAAFGRAQAIYQNSAEGQDQMVNDLVSSGQASFDPNYSYIPTDENGEQILDENLNAIELGGDGGEGSMNAFIENVWKIETDPNAEGFDQSAYNRAVKAWEQMKVQWDSDVGTAESFIFKNYAQGEEWINAQLSGQFSQSVIDKAWENFLLSNEGKQWQGTLSQASVDELVNTWTESFDPNMSKEEFVTKMITGEDEKVNEDLRANAEEAWEQMNGQFLNNAAAIAASVTDRSLINSKSDDNVIKGLIENAGLIATPGLIKAVRDELAKGDNFNESVANDLATNDVETVKDNLSSNKNDKGYNSINDYFNALDSYDAIDAQYGNTGAIDPDRENAKNTVNTIIENALSGSGGNLASPDTARTLEGIISNTDIENWGNMSDDERKRAVLSGIKNSGRFSVGELKDFVVDYVDSKIREIIDVDNQNLKASGLADVGELINYIDSLKLEKNGQNAVMEKICQKMMFVIDVDEISWSSSVAGAEARIWGGNWVQSKETKTQLGKPEKEGALKVLNGKLYQSSTKSDTGLIEWKEITSKNLKITGDGHTNTSEQTKGIYELLVYILDPNTGKVTPGGTVNLKQDHNYYQSKETDGDKKFNEVQDYR